MDQESIDGVIVVIILKRLQKSFLALALLFLSSTSSAALIVDIEIEELGGDYFLFKYTLTNPDPVTPFSFFIFDAIFDYTLFEDLAVDASPPDWDGVAFPIDAPSLLDGVADWAYFPGLIPTTFVLPPTSSIGGFGATAKYVGTSPFPELAFTQFFDIFDESFTPVFSGLATTTTFIPKASVPEPSTSILMTLSLLGFLMVKRKAK